MKLVKFKSFASNTPNYIVFVSSIPLTTSGNASRAFGQIKSVRGQIKGAFYDAYDNDVKSKVHNINKARNQIKTVCGQIKCAATSY